MLDEDLGERDREECRENRYEVDGIAHESAVPRLDRGKLTIAPRWGRHIRRIPDMAEDGWANEKGGDLERTVSPLFPLGSEMGTALRTNASR